MTSETPELDRSGSRIDHLNIAVPDLGVAVAFYEATLAAIGIVKHQYAPRVHRRHPRRGPDLYEAALQAGASGRQATAVHLEYHPDYYGAFVNDPHGINLEAVCHRPIR